MVRPLKDNVVGKIETPLNLMLGAVGFVLLMACATVAHMLRARTADRQKEIAVRVEAVVVVNERAAERYSPGENPIGKRLVLGGQAGSTPNWLTIVGVTDNASLHDMDGEMFPEIYLAALQTPAFLGEGTDPAVPHMSYLTLVVRAEGDPARLTAAVLKRGHAPA